MPQLKYQPVRHNHYAFLAKAAKRSGFRRAYAKLKEEYGLLSQMPAARKRARLNQRKSER